MKDKHREILPLIAVQLDYLVNMETAKDDPVAYRGYLMGLRRTTKHIITLITEIEDDETSRPPQ